MASEVRSTFTSASAEKLQRSWKVSVDYDGKGSENRNKSEDLPVSEFVTCGEQAVDRCKSSDKPLPRTKQIHATGIVEMRAGSTVPSKFRTYYIAS